MAFSAGVKLGDLDDFLAASQECVKPLIQAATTAGPAKLDATPEGLRGAVETKRPQLIRTKASAADPNVQVGQVSLSDCLACSGCVTTAETVLLEQQSGAEFLERSRTSPLTVVSISSEARSSFAASSGLGPLEVHRRLATGLSRLGVDYVLECSPAEAVSALECGAELMRRLESGQGLPLLTSHCPGWTCYAEKLLPTSVIERLVPVRPPQQVQGLLVKTVLLERHNMLRFHRWWRACAPLLAGCGLPLTRSSKVLSAAAQHLPLNPSDLYHVSVQPCFDRKIEAARPQFALSGGVREVDTVLSTREVLDLLLAEEPTTVSDGSSNSSELPQLGAPGRSFAEKASAAFGRLPPCPLESEILTDLFLQPLSTGRPEGRPLLIQAERNAGSGGFVEHAFREVARLRNDVEWASSLRFRTCQNEDMREVTLEGGSGKQTIKFTTAAGFRNVQSVARRLSKMDTPEGRLQCGHFIEALACPGGCLNGGGQLQAPNTSGGPTGVDSAEERRKRLDHLDDVHHRGEGIAVVKPADHPLVLPLYRYMAQSDVSAAAVDASGAGGAAAADAADSCGAAGIAAAGLPGERSAPCEAGARGAGRRVSSGSAAAGLKALSELVGSPAVRSWVGAAWKSLKVDDQGQTVVGASALRW